MSSTSWTPWAGLIGSSSLTYRNRENKPVVNQILRILKIQTDPAKSSQTQGENINKISVLLFKEKFRFQCDKRSKLDSHIKYVIKSSNAHTVKSWR